MVANRELLLNGVIHHHRGVWLDCLYRLINDASNDSRRSIGLGSNIHDDEGNNSFDGASEQIIDTFDTFDSIARIG